MSFVGNFFGSRAVEQRITMTTFGHTYPTPAIPFRKDNVPKLTVGSQVIHDGFAENATLLGAPQIALPVFQSQIADLVAANQAMKTHKGAEPDRAVKIEIVWSTLLSYRQHVTLLCVAQPNLAGLYVASAGFREAKIPLRNEVPLKVAATYLPGQVLLTIHSYLLETPGNRPYAKRTHLLRHTLDGGQTFVEDQATSGSQALVSGLPPFVPIGFEVAAKDASGVGGWSQRVGITLIR